MCSYGIQGESVCHDIDLGIGTVMESMIHALSRSVYRANIVAMQCKCTMNPTEENGTKLERCCIILWQGSILYMPVSILHSIWCFVTVAVNHSCHVDTKDIMYVEQFTSPLRRNCYYTDTTLGYNNVFLRQ